MASVHRIPRSPYWHGAFRQDGRLIARSTKCADRKAALKIATEWERAARMAERGELIEQQSRTVLSDIMARAGVDSGIRGTPIREFMTNWLKAQEATKAGGTYSRYKTPIESFVRALGPRAQRSMTSITSRDIEDFLARRLASGKSQSTSRLDVKILGICFSRAVRQGIMAVNPAAAVELPKEDTQVRGYFTAEEIARLIAVADPEWSTLIMLAYFTGQRLSDCISIQWSQVDLVQGLTKFKQQKTGALVVVPIHPDLAANLQALPHRTGPVLRSLSESALTGRRGASETFKALLKSAGVDLGETRRAGRIFNTRTFHSLRHSFTSALANAGVAPEIRMQLTGHKSLDIHAAYSHHDMGSLVSAVQKMPRLPKVV